MILHSPYGLRVHGPLALAVSRRLRERYGIDEKPTASDDGIVVRLPDTDWTTRPPGAELFVFDADEIDPIVTAEVGGSALFASRFRECAARALLLPRRHPGRRSPLWHQRQRAAQLLDVARKYPDFPIVLETIRECLQDVYDVPALVGLMTGIAQRRVRVLEAETATPSPFAASLLFGYVGAFMYEGDTPLAERRAAALSLDSTLLAELLGRVELRELLDPEVIAATGRQLQHLSADRAARDAEGGRRSAAAAGPADRGRSRRPGRRRRRRRLAGGPARRPARADGVVRRAQLVGGHRRHRPAARRRRGGGSAGRAGRLHRAGRRPAGRAARPLRPHPHPVHHRRGRRPVRPGPAGDRRRAGPAGRATAGWCAATSSPPATHRRHRAANSGATPTCCAFCGGARWPRCAPRSSRSAPPPTRGSCRPGTAASGPPASSGLDGLVVRDRSAGRRADAGLGARAAGAGAAGARLLPRDARRAAGDRRGHLVGRRVDLGQRRLDRAAPGRYRAADPGRARRRSSSPTPTARSWTRWPAAARTSSASSPAPGSPRPTLKAALWELIWAGWVTGDTFAPVRAMLGGAGQPQAFRPGAPRTAARRG